MTKMLEHWVSKYIHTYLGFYKSLYVQILLHLLSATAEKLEGDEAFLDLALPFLSDSSLPEASPSMAACSCLQLAHIAAACAKAGNRQAFTAWSQNNKKVAWSDTEALSLDSSKPIKWRQPFMLFLMS